MIAVDTPVTDIPDRDVLALRIATIASDAGAAVMEVYNQGFDVVTKEDGSPLTKADLAADAVISAGLKALAPHIPILSEETADQIDPTSLGSTFFVVDPLDGTKEYVGRNGEFSINIALVEEEQPTVGVVYAPAHDTMWTGGTTASVGQIEPGTPVTADMMTKIRTRPNPKDPVRAVASRSHRDTNTDAFLNKMKGCNQTSIGSALKFCLVAEGKADVYPRFAPTMVWDTAAGVAVLQAAGGLVLDDDGNPMKVAYGPNGWRNGAFTAWGCAGLKNRTL